MRILTILLLLWCSNAYALFTDLKFGQAQIADSQWDVNACTTTTTCNIYSTNPGTVYQIPFWNGVLSWASGDYVQFSTDAADINNPWLAVQYDASGNVKQAMGTGHIVSMNTQYFFFVGNDYNTGQLFSMTQGLANSNGVSWTGTLNPTVIEVNSLSSGGSTSPLAAGQTVAPIVAPVVPSYKSLRPLMTHYLGSSTNYPGAQSPDMAFDGNIATKYLNFDKFNTGVTVKLSQGKVATGVQFTTAEDFAGRDPASFIIYGSNDNVSWMTISSQSISLPAARQSQSGVFNLNNITPYVYYKIEFPTVNNPDTTCGFDCNSMQIAEITFIYDENNPATSVDTGTIVMTPFPGVLCCGASATQFNANPVNLNNVMNFKTLSTGSSVYIDQYGVNNTVYVEQVGSKSNGVVYVGNGLSNDITITQTATNDTQTNYVNLDVNGNSNTINIEQYSANLTSFTKGAFVHVIDNNNQVTIQQKDDGNHYASVSLSGGYKTVNILQQGPASHMADVTLSGQPTSLSLQQSGATQQFYSINFNCTTAGGCQPIQVQQGQ